MKLWQALITLIFPWVALAYEPSHLPARSDMKPAELENVGVDEHLGQKLSLETEFTDDKGEAVTLKRYFSGHKPVLMAMIYYNCPNLCNFQLNGLIEVVREMKGGIAGQDYEFVAVSMDSSETSELAAKKKANYLKALNQPGAEKGWHFLVGSAASVKKLTTELGFRYRWDDNLKQFAHAAATYVVSPDGMLSRYLYGIQFSPATLRLSLVEASDGKIGGVMEQIALFCFQFDPTKNKYTLYAYNLMRIGAFLTIFVLGIFLVPVWMRERQRPAALS